HRLDAIFLLGALGAGIYFAIATGSRGGFLAAIAGGTVWLALLMSRSRSRSRWFMLGLSAVAVVALLLPAADFLLRRIAETPANAATTGKLQIWTYSLQLFSRFPILGVGPGGFATAFNHFKPSGGSTTVWHAENEYIQWIVEMGAVGGLVALVLFWHGIRAAWPMAFQQRFDEPELIFGALAALGAFAVHALVEFVFQIPSTAVLAAALLGFLLGARDSGLRPAVPQALRRSRMIFNYAVTFAFLVIALLQGLAFWAWHRAKSEPIPAARIALGQRSLQLWPWAVSRQIGLTRLRVQHLNALPRSEASRLAQRTRSELQSALARDPYHWELRLERAWFDLAFGNDQNRAVAEAREVMRLNPLQVQIPLRFARHFRDENPVLAWEFLSKAPVEPGMTLRETLFLAWDLTKDASKLWDLTPNSPGALKTLGEVALELKLYPLAVQAYDSVRDQFEPEMLAEIYLRAQRPDLALSVLEEAGMGFRVRRLRAEALRQSGKIAAAMRVAESLCLDSAARGQLLGSIKTSETLERLRASWTAKPDDVLIARQLAEKICEAPPSVRDVTLLKSLAAKHPAELRLTWLLYQTQRDINRLPEAAQTLMQLAIRIERLEG
ncbi:MAG: O-antigen ligase family protein, partial [Verrucomicrobiota bacterium]